MTATTPTSNAVRFETGAITLDLSNRFHLPKHTEGGDKEELGKSFFFKVDNGSICLSLCVFRLTLMLFCLFILVDVLIFVL